MNFPIWFKPFAPKHVKNIPKYYSTKKFITVWLSQPQVQPIPTLPSQLHVFPASCGQNGGMEWFMLCICQTSSPGFLQLLAGGWHSRDGLSSPCIRNLCVFVGRKPFKHHFDPFGCGMRMWVEKHNQLSGPGIFDYGSCLNG